MKRPFAQTFGSGRRLAILVNVLVMVALALLAAGILIYLTGFTDLRRRFDLTRAGTYTLSRETVRLIEQLEKDVEIIAVFDRVQHTWDPDGVLLRAMEYATDLLQEYRVRAQGRITVEDLDPRRDYVRVAEVFGELRLRDYNRVIVRCGENRRILGLVPDLAEIDTSQVAYGGQPQLIAYRAEEAVSSAVYDVTQDKRYKVYVVTGHEELSLEQSGGPGGSLFRDTLVQDNVQVEPLSLFSLKFVPKDADAVALLGPRQDFVEAEVSALDEYLRQGGSLLVASDPAGTRALDALWQRLGLTLERTIVCYSQSGVAREAQPSETWIGPRAPGSYGRHAVTQGMIQDGDVVVVARNGAVASTPEAVTRFSSLLLSHPESWGDNLREDGTAGDYLLEPREGETTGQRAFAAALEPAGEYDGSRVVFVAGVPWVSNVALNTYPGNSKFLRRSVAWLMGKKHSHSVPLAPRRPPAHQTDLRPEEYHTIFMYVVVYLPAGALLLAFLVWMARR